MHVRLWCTCAVFVARTLAIPSPGFCTSSRLAAGALREAGQAGQGRAADLTGDAGGNGHTMRSRVNSCMNKFKRLGFIETTRMASRSTARCSPSSYTTKPNKTKISRIRSESWSEGLALRDLFSDPGDEPLRSRRVVPTAAEGVTPLLDAQLPEQIAHPSHVLRRDVIGQFLVATVMLKSTAPFLTLLMNRIRSNSARSLRRGPRRPVSPSAAAISRTTYRRCATFCVSPGSSTSYTVLFELFRSDSFRIIIKTRSPSYGRVPINGF